MISYLPPIVNPKLVPAVKGASRIPLITIPPPTMDALPPVILAMLAALAC